MVIKPYGFSIREVRILMTSFFEHFVQLTLHFFPKSFLSKEAAHIEGFAKECAVVTHHRLMNDPDGEGVIVDPTSIGRRINRSTNF